MASNTPHDTNSTSFAGNAGMDGFNYDTEYGAGVEDAHNDPELSSRANTLSALPDGFVTAGEPTDDISFDGIEDRDFSYGMGEFTKQASELIDLSWLTDVEVDEARLPRSPNDAVVRGLEEAWSRQTDGVNLVPAKVLPSTVTRTPTSGLPGDQFRDVVASAIRRVTFGEKYEDVVRDVVARVFSKTAAHDPNSVELRNAAAALRALAAEEGLLGRVYIRESAFPGLAKGRWDRDIRKHCASARYILARKNSAISGMGRYLGRQVVTDIPWADALAIYRPMFAAKGQKLAGDARTALRRAFLATAPKVERDLSHLPVVPRENLPTYAEAKAVLASIPTPERVRLVPTSDGGEKKARETLARWFRDRFISAEDHDRLVNASSVPWGVRVETGANLVVASGHKPGVYDGAGVHYYVAPTKVTKDAAWAAMKQAELKFRLDSKALDTIRHFAKVGMLTQRECDVLLRSGRNPTDLLKIAVRRAQANRPQVAPQASAPARTYQGETRAHVMAPTPRAIGVDRAKEITARLGELRQERARTAVWALVASGKLTYADAEKLTSSDMPPADMLKMAGARVQAPGKVASVGTPKPKRNYQGNKLTEFVGAFTTKQVVSDRDVRKVLAWVNREMNEGICGSDLDTRIATRFAAPLREAAGEQLVTLRRSKEAIAGHLYVDANVYASPTGITGCDTGADKHRANAIPYIKPMDRCSGCTLNTGSRCQKYGKEFLPAYTPDELQEFQSGVLRDAGMTDADHIAAVYVNDYGLGDESQLDDIQYNEMPSSEALGEFLFDGWIVEDES